MNVSSANSAVSGLAAAQSMFEGAAQAASGVGGADSGSAGGAASEAIQVALLQKTLGMERSLVNILA